MPSAAAKRRAGAQCSTPRYRCSWSLTAQSVHHHRTDRLAALHQLEAVVDVLELEPVRDQRVDLNLAVHVPVDDLRHVAAAARAAESGAFPHAPGHELERPCGDLL